MHRCPCTTVVFSGSTNSPPSARVSSISIASSTRNHSAPCDIRNRPFPTGSNSTPFPAPIVDPSLQKSSPPGRSTLHNPRTIAFRCASSRAKCSTEWHTTTSANASGNGIASIPATWKFALGNPDATVLTSSRTPSKYLIPLEQQVGNVAPTAATRIDHSHPWRDIPPQDLVEQIDIDLPKLLLERHLSHLALCRSLRLHPRHHQRRHQLRHIPTQLEHALDQPRTHICVLLRRHHEQRLQRRVQFEVHHRHLKLVLKIGRAHV